MSRSDGCGLTLVELLIAIVIATVLTAIALPVVKSHILNARRTEAIAALRRIQAAEERFFLEHNRYAADITAAPPAGLGLALGAETRYRLEVQLSGAPGLIGFTAHAHLRQPGTDPDPRCSDYSVNQNGIRAAFDAAGADHTDECWRGAPR